jgi:hypothetical protein
MSTISRKSSIREPSTPASPIKKESNIQTHAYSATKVEDKKDDNSA